ncbi:MAG: hypothetical protein KA791_03880 [Flavobacteriales bacterium]|nr:hypothetical protein [Flavobacteriales bacterium]
MRTAATGLVFLMYCGALSAQRIDSIPDYLTEPPELIVKLDMRGSFIGNESVRFAGVKLGLEHAGRVQYGIGYSFLLSPVENTVLVPGLGEVATRLRLGYVTPYFEFAFYQKDNWELRIPVQFGIGSGSVVYEDAEGRKRKLQHSGVFLYEPSMTVQYRFLKYFAIGGGWGYRLVLRSAPLADGLTAPIYTFGLRVFFGDLWRDIRPEPADNQ